MRNFVVLPFFWQLVFFVLSILKPVVEDRTAKHWETRKADWILSERRHFEDKSEASDKVNPYDVMAECTTPNIIYPTLLLLFYTLYPY
jgi:hypothetical protein